MHTVFEVYAVHPDPAYVSQAAQAAFDLVDRLENELSRFRANSDITRINHLAAGQSTSVAATTMECLLIARHMFDLTAGAFDIAIGTGLPALHLDSEACTVQATAEGVRLDLGGIGKGYAVDLMAEVLADWGLTAALVHGGFSSVLALDPPPGRDGWPLTLSDPADPSCILVRLSVGQTALGASGIRNTDHIREPANGVPVRDRLGAWVTVPRPDPGGPAAGEASEGPRLAATAVADALTTAFMVLSPVEIGALCEQSPGLEAWVLPATADGQPGNAALLHFGGVRREAAREGGPGR